MFILKGMSDRADMWKDCDAAGRALVDAVGHVGEISLSYLS